jgi:hypothetical protein
MHEKWNWQLKASSVPAGMESLEDEAEEEPYEMVFSVVQANGVPEFAGLTASAGDRLERIEEFAAMLEFVSFTPEQRKELAKKGQALPDGSFPIRNKADLKNAIRAYGRSGKTKAAQVRKHIIARAKALGATKIIPEKWTMTASGEDLRSRISEFSASIEEPKKA